MRVNSGIVTTSLFKIHIPVMSKCIWLCTKLSGMEVDDEVELGKKFRPPCLMAVQKLSRGEIFEIFVVGDDNNGSRGTFKVVAPNAECFIDSEELPVMDIVV